MSVTSWSGRAVPGGRLALMLAGFVLAAATVVGTLAVLFATTGGSAAPAAVTPRSAEGLQWSAAVFADVDLERHLVLVDWHRASADSVVRIVEPGGAGRVVAELRLGYNPAAVRAPATGRLLVSDVVILRDAEGRELPPGQRLLVFRGPGLELEREVPLPDRVIYRAPRPIMLLSADESTLYYIAHTYRSEPASCQVGGDAAVCDLISIGIVPLGEGATAGTPPAFVELQADCRTPTLAPYGRSGVLVACPGSPGEVRTIDADGSSRVVGSIAAAAGYDPDPRHARHLVTHRHAFAIQEGIIGERIASILIDGRLMLLNEDGSREFVNLELGALRPTWAAEPEVAGNVVRVPLHREPSQLVSAVATLEFGPDGRLADVQVEKLPVPVASISLRDGRAAAVDEEGAIRLLEVKGGRVYVGDRVGRMETLSPPVLVR